MAASSFPKSVRLATGKDFTRVFEKPRKVRANGFTFYLRENDMGQARLGLAVPKKAVRLAVDRNRIKRLVRESFRQQSGLGSVDIVFLAYKGIDERTNHDIMSALNQAWIQVAKIYA